VKRLAAAIKLKTGWSYTTAILFANKHLDRARLMVADGEQATLEGAMLELAARVDS